MAPRRHRSATGQLYGPEFARCIFIGDASSRTETSGGGLVLGWGPFHDGTTELFGPGQKVRPPRPARDGIRAGTRTADEPVLELRDLVLDHLHPVGRHQLAGARRPPAPAARRSASAGRSAAHLGGVRLAMAQIASAYPTAGGLYHWGSILGNRFTGWLTAWLNLLGLVTVLGAINVGTFYFFFGAFGRLRHRGHAHPPGDLRRRDHRRCRRW